MLSALFTAVLSETPESINYVFTTKKQEVNKYYQYINAIVFNAVKHVL